MSELPTSAIRGLPAPLPPGETLLWQGAPDWKSLARRKFHIRALALYFAVVLAARGLAVASGGGSPGDIVMAVLWLLPVALTGLGLIALFAWLIAGTTVYTITDRRLVMHIGVALPVTFNLPFRRIASAALRSFPDGTGDIALQLTGEDRIAYLHLWPHARPWYIKRPEPMLRSVPDAAAVAELLADAAATAGVARAGSVRAGPARGSKPALADAA